MEADFSGYATKAGLVCSDGKTIMQGAFKGQHLQKVPLVWQHGHNDIENVLGHAILEYRDNGDVYTYGFFNESDKAKLARIALEHGDLDRLSIWANELVQRSNKVLHGAIREVSLVLSGANPGAVIDNVTIRHSDGDEQVYEDEAIIRTDLDLEHKDMPDELAHAEGDEKDKDDKDDKDGEGDEDETIQDIYDNMSEKEQDVVHYMIGRAMVAKTESDDKDGDTDETKQDNVGDADDENTLNHSDQEGSQQMTKINLFEGTKDGNQKAASVLSHSDLQNIASDFESTGSLRKTMRQWAEEHLEHGIQDLELLFPDAQAVTNTPEWDKRRTEWVAGVLGGATKRPFARIKSWSADLTYDEARAKGYIKGNMKKEEFFSIAKRETTPTTIYKKQKLDRDDIIDITDFDVVMWMKGEMRLMLDEEIARAILVGDGREVDDDDKVDEQKIRPIALDDPFYVVSFGVNLEDGSSSMEEVMDAIILNRQYYKGSGMPTMYTTETRIAQMLLLRDDMGRKLYRSVDEIATELRVRAIVAVEILDEYPDIVAIIVNMSDYTIGTDKGGQVSFFDDFDIDFNQEKYLIETRMSGALTKPKSAMVVLTTLVGDTAVVPTKPAWDIDTNTVTIPTVAGVEYRDDEGNVLADAAAIVLEVGDNLTVQAWPEDTYYFAGGFRTRWSFIATQAPA